MAMASSTRRKHVVLFLAFAVSVAVMLAPPLAAVTAGSAPAAGPSGASVNMGALALCAVMGAYYVLCWHDAKVAGAREAKEAEDMSTETKKKPRIGALDSLRFILIAYIASGHFIHTATRNPFLLRLISQINVVVGAFFVISGYVAAYTTTELGQRKGSKRLDNAVEFVITRIMGHWPLHIVVLLLFSPVFLFVDISYSGVATAAWNGFISIFMLQAWFPTSAEVWNAPTWNVVSGVVPAGHHAVPAALTALRSHHSGSSLPDQVAAMSQQVVWKCQPCGHTCGKTAEFCAQCGQHWTKVAEGYAGRMWKSSWPAETDEGQYPQSPRARRKSPRKRTPAPSKGQQPKGGKQQSKATPPAAGKGGKSEPARPSLDSLPSPPAAPAIQVPRTAAQAASAAVSVEKTQLEALTGCLFAAKDALPPEVRETLERLQLVETNSTTKDLHKAVAAQSQAKKQVLHIQAARASYSESWHSYVGKVSSLLQTQLGEQVEQLTAFDDAELQWTTALEKASQDLARLAKTSTGSSDPGELDYMDAEEQVVEADIQTARESSREKQLEASRQLVASIESVRLNAQEQLQQHGRDGSRTPRRRKPDVDLTKEEPPGFLAEAPWLSPCTSLTGLHGRCPRGHSVVYEEDFVDGWHASFAGVALEHEVSLFNVDLSVEHTVWIDPRIQPEDPFDGVQLGHNSSAWDVHDEGNSHYEALEVFFLEGYAFGCDGGRALSVGTGPSSRAFRVPVLQMVTQTVELDEVRGTSSYATDNAPERVPLVTCTASANSVLASCVPPVARTSAYLANPSGPSEGAFASKAGSLSSLAQSQPATFACECPEWSSCVPPVAGTIASLDNYSELSNTASAASASKVGSLSSLEQLPPPARACESVAIPPFAPQPNTQPPALLGQFGPPRPSTIAHMRAQAVQLQPQELTVFPLSEIPVGQLKILASVAGCGRGLRRYTCLDRQFHVMARRAAEDWSLTDYFADAIGANPQSGTELCLLTYVAWVAKSICCLALAPGAEAEHIIALLIQTCGVPPDIVLRAAQANALFLQDANGRVWDALPLQVEEVQWLALRLDASRCPQLAPAVAGGTTFTTTEMRAASDGPTMVTFIMTGCGTTVRLQPQVLAQVDVQASVMSLVLALAIQGRIPEGAQLQITGAFPRSRYTNEYLVSLVCFPPDGDVHVAYDPSNGGAFLHAMTVNPGTMPKDVVMPAQAERGLIVLVNGIPQHAQNRPLCNGDLVQLVNDPGSHSVVPATFLLREINRLRFLSLPMRLPRLPRPSAHFSESQAQARTGLQLFYEARFTERKAIMGSPDAEHQPIYLLGPNHVPIFVQIPGRSCPSLRQAQNEVHDLGIFDDSTALADAFDLLFTIPVFVSVPECVSYATMLVPAPGYPADFLCFSVTRVEASPCRLTEAFTCSCQRQPLTAP
eukprot:s5753_g2.t1